VAVNGSEIAHTHILEKLSRHEYLFKTFKKIVYERKKGRSETRDAFNEAHRHSPETIVEMAGAHPCQIKREGADVLRYRMFIIVQDYDKVFPHVSEVVESLEGHAAGQ